MEKTLVLLLIFFTSATVFSQVPGIQKKQKPPIELYKIISAKGDTTHVDTTLSIKKLYKFNYLRKDNFELLPFSNVAHTYNSLSYSPLNNNLKPLFGARAKYFNYKDVDDISYYQVPTPLTELYFKTAFAQGQQLDAFFTINTSKQFNFSLAYKGVRSLGLYQNNLSSSGNLILTTNYNSKNERYHLKAHFTAQDMTNEENGGLAPSSIPLFINDDPDFEDRGRLEVNFEDAENRLEGLRYYVDQEYELIKSNDSIQSTILSFGNTLSFEDTYYKYNQESPFNGFGESYEITNLRDLVTLEDFNATVYTKLTNPILGKFSGFVRYNEFNYGYDSVLILDSGRINNRIKGSILQTGATYSKEYKGFELTGEGAVNLSGDFAGNYLKASASFALNEDNKATASINLHSAAPNFNYLLYQSDYVNYNWQNDFDNIKTQELKFELQSDKFLKGSVSYTGIDDYTYFGIKVNDSTPSPIQFDQRVDYLKVKAEKEFRYRKFGLTNTLIYQKAVSGTEVFNVPDFITRNTLFYEDQWFEKALFLQTGLTFKYFSNYNMNDYDPVLAEFYVQNSEKIGGFPVVDLFFNGKIRQTRIYFIYENVNALFNNQNEYFSAPGYPYRDPVLRFGLVWNFFL